MTTSSFTWHGNEQDKIGEAKFTVDWMTIDASGLLRMAEPPPDWDGCNFYERTELIK